LEDKKSMDIKNTNEPSDLPTLEALNRRFVSDIERTEQIASSIQVERQEH